MKQISLIGFLAIMPLFLYAQQQGSTATTAEKNSFKTGFAHLYIRTPGIGASLLYCQYTRRLNSYLDLSAGLAYANGTKTWGNPTTNTLRSCDLSLGIRLLKIKRFSLKPAVGISMARFTELEVFSPPIKDLNNDPVTYATTRDRIAGTHLMADWEFSLSNNFFVAARTTVYNYFIKDTMFGLGIHAGVRF